MSFTEDELQAFNTILDSRLTAQRQEFESAVTHQLEAQQAAIEQMLNEHFEQLAQQSLEDTVMATNGVHPLEAFEVQTELPWDDLNDMIGKALDERISALSEAISRSLQNLEQYLSVRIHGLRDEFARSQPQVSTLHGDPASVQEVLQGIEHLEHVVESLQVAMTANHALLSNRLYHHQQQPLERAHRGGHPLFPQGNGQANALAMAKDRIARGLEPETTDNVKIEEHQGL